MRMRRMGRRYERDPDEDKRPLNRENLAVFGRLLAYVRPYSRPMALSIVALVFSAGLGLVLPLVVLCSIQMMPSPGLKKGSR